jgi:hypothetical protein
MVRDVAAGRDALVSSSVMARHSSHVLELARRGAEARFRELAQEAKYLIDLFPHLRDSFDKDELPLPFIIAKGSGRLTKASAGPPRRRRMSAASRKAASARMQKYWAARRNAEKSDQA